MRGRSGRCPVRRGAPLWSYPTPREISRDSARILPPEKGRAPFRANPRGEFSPCDRRQDSIARIWRSAPGAWGPGRPARGHRRRRADHLRGTGRRATCGGVRHGRRRPAGASRKYGREGNRGLRLRARQCRPGQSWWCPGRCQFSCRHLSFRVTPLLMAATLYRTPETGPSRRSGQSLRRGYAFADVEFEFPAAIVAGHAPELQQAGFGNYGLERDGDYFGGRFAGPEGHFHRGELLEFSGEVFNQIARLIVFSGGGGKEAKLRGFADDQAELAAGNPHVSALLHTESHDC